MRTAVLHTVSTLALAAFAALPIPTRGAPTSHSHHNHTGDTELFGYLFANFYKNNEQVFFQLSDGDDPLSYSPVNNNKPVLVSDVGSKTARDPFIAYNPTEDKYWLLGNNQSLIALGIANGGDFNKAYFANYSGAVLFTGLDNTLTKWSPPQIIDFAGPGSLHVFAPEAIWDYEKSQFLLYWTGAYANATTGKFWATYTTDFTDFSTPFVYYEEDNSVYDLTIAAMQDDGKSYVRFWSSQGLDSKIRGQYSLDGLSGTWIDINSTATPNDNKGVLNPDKPGSGISVFKDNQKDNTFYVLVNEDSAEVPYQTEDIKVFPYKYADAPNFPRGTSQGSVLPLRKFQHEALLAKSWNSSAAPQQSQQQTQQKIQQQTQQQTQQQAQSEGLIEKLLTNFVPLFPHH